MKKLVLFAVLAAFMAPVAYADVGPKQGLPPCKDIDQMLKAEKLKASQQVQQPEKKDQTVKSAQ